MPDVGSQALEVVLGLMFVFLVFSLVCSALQELVATLLSWRAKGLEEGLRSMLQGAEAPDSEDSLFTDFVKHPRIKAMLARKRVFGRNQSVPSYLSARTFSLVLLDTLAPPAPGKASRDLVAELRGRLATLEGTVYDGLAKQLTGMLDNVGDNLATLRKEVEDWFDDTMNRVSGWYRRKTQLFLVIFGMLVAVVGNVDAVHIADRLWNDPVARAAVVAQVEATAAGTDTEELEEQVRTVDGIRELQLPVGWTTSAEADENPRAFPESIDATKVIGILLSGIALSFGAPFWFDALSKLARLRPTGKPEGRAPGSSNP
jgi:hypothetical protein